MIKKIEMCNQSGPPADIQELRRRRGTVIDVLAFQSYITTSEHQWHFHGDDAAPEYRPTGVLQLRIFNFFDQLAIKFWI